MPRARFTVRALMIAVAVVGIALGFELMRGRRAASLQRAEAERRLEEFYQAYADKDEREIAKAEVSKGELEAAAAFHRGFRRKYERAARYPWLPVAPDPQ